MQEKTPQEKTPQEKTPREAVKLCGARILKRLNGLAHVFEIDEGVLELVVGEVVAAAKEEIEELSGQLPRHRRQDPCPAILEGLAQIAQL